MSSKKLSLMDQANELADDLNIPHIPLPSRAANRQQGREVVTPKETNLEPEPPIEKAFVPETPPIRSEHKPSETSEEDVLETLTTEGPILVPLNCRVPQKVRQILDQKIHELKAKGKKIKMEGVVTAALVSFLKIEDE